MDIFTYIVGPLVPFVMFGAPLLLVVALIMRQWDARGSRLASVQRGIGTASVMAAVVAGISFFIPPNDIGVSRYQVGYDLWIFFLLLIPVGLTLLSVMARPSRRTLYSAICALVLAVFCVVGAMSIGLAYLPAAALLIVAGAVGLASPRAA